MNHGNNTYPERESGAPEWNSPVPGAAPAGAPPEHWQAPGTAIPVNGYPQPNGGYPYPANGQIPVSTYVPVQQYQGPYPPLNPASVQAAPRYPALQPNPYFAQAPMPAAQGAYPQPAGAYAAYLSPQFAPEGYRKNPRVRAAASELNKTAAIGVAMFATSLFFQVILMLLFSTMGIPLLSGNHAAFYWLNAVMVPLATLMPGLIYLRIRKPTLQSMVRFENKGVFNAILAVFAGLSICLLLNYPAGLVQFFFESTGSDPGSYEPTAFYPESTWIYMLAVVILAPVIEEFVFRGIIFATLEKFGAGFAIVASSLVFGMAHITPGSFIFATGAGLVFGFVYYKTRNLWVAVAIHFLNNLLAMIDTYQETIFGKGNELLAEIVMYWAPVSLGLLCLLFLILFRRKSFFAPSKKEEAPTWGNVQMNGSFAALRPGESAKAILKTPCIWVTVGYMVINLVLSYLIY